MSAALCLLLLALLAVAGVAILVLIPFAALGWSALMAETNNVQRPGSDS